MACTVEEFRIRFPEFADDTEFLDLRIELFLDDAVNVYMGTDELRWCNNYNYAQCYLAAHLLTVGTGSEAGSSGASAGPISSKSAGGVSVTKAITTKDRADGDDFLMSTVYGQQYKITRDNCFVGVLVAVC